MSAAPVITEEVLTMISDESRRKLREMQLEQMVEALDNQEANRETYLSMSFDARLNLLIDECYTCLLYTSPSPRDTR